MFKIYSGIWNLLVFSIVHFIVVILKGGLFILKKMEYGKRKMRDILVWLMRYVLLKRKILNFWKNGRKNILVSVITIHQIMINMWKYLVKPWTGINITSLNWSGNWRKVAWLIKVKFNTFIYIHFL